MNRRWLGSDSKVEQLRRRGDIAPDRGEMGEGENPLRGRAFRGKSQAMFRGNGGARELMNGHSREC
ncbi:MAG: hypothetical protein SOY65_07780 [Marinifilaceae bacterium]|nr:hypothetical protein [Marinifilaceae bacterium]